MRKATGSYRTYSSLVKLQPRFLSLPLGRIAALVPGFFSEVPALGQNTDDIEQKKSEMNNTTLLIIKKLAYINFLFRSVPRVEGFPCI